MPGPLESQFSWQAGKTMSLLKHPVTSQAVVPLWSWHQSPVSSWAGASDTLSLSCSLWSEKGRTPSRDLPDLREVQYQLCLLLALSAETDFPTSSSPRLLIHQMMKMCGLLSGLGYLNDSLPEPCSNSAWIFISFLGMANYFSFFRAGFFPPVSIREVGFGITITQKPASFLRGTGWIITGKDAEWNWGLCSRPALPWDGAALLHQEVRDLLAAEMPHRLFGGRNVALLDEVLNTTFA